jgi:hypothetical protein
MTALKLNMVAVIKQWIHNKYNIKPGQILEQQKLKEKRKNGGENCLNNADCYKTLVEIT